MEELASRLRAEGAIEPIDILERRLKALGAVVDVPPDERVYRALVKLWTGRRGPPPSRSAVAAEARVCDSSMHHHLDRLMRSGRVTYHPDFGWLPIVPEKVGRK